MNTDDNNSISSYSFSENDFVNINKILCDEEYINAALRSSKEMEPKIFSVISKHEYPSENEINKFLFSNEDELQKYFCLRNKTVLLEKFEILRYQYNIYRFIFYLKKYFSIKEFSKNKKFLEILFSNHDYHLNHNQNVIYQLIVDNGIYTEEALNCLPIESKYSGSIQRCLLLLGGIDILKKLTKSSLESIRYEAYSRLGVEFVEDMLNDTSARIQILGVRYMPYGYTVPKNLLTSKSVSVLEEMICKISINQLPLLLADKRLDKKPYIKNIIESRFNSGI